MNFHRTIPLIVALLAPTAAQAAVNLDPPGDGGSGGTGTGTDPLLDTGYWSKNYTKSDLFGSSDWGAGYKINGGVWAIPATDVYNDRLGARLSAETYAKVN